jgi:hypothetical protein
VLGVASTERLERRQAGKIAAWSAQPEPGALVGGECLPEMLMQRRQLVQTAARLTLRYALTRRPLLDGPLLNIEDHPQLAILKTEVVTQATEHLPRR